MIWVKKKKSGSLTSSEESEGSGSGSKEQMLVPVNFKHKAGDGTKTRDHHLSEIVPALQAKAGRTQASFVVSGLIQSRGLETRKDDVSHCLKGQGKGSAGNFIVLNATNPHNKTEKREFHPAEVTRSVKSGFRNQQESFVACGTATLTDMQPTSTTGTTTKNGAQGISEKSKPRIFQTLICSVLGSRVSLFRLLAEGRVSRILEVLFSLRFVGSHQRKNLDCCYSKMSRGSYLTMKEGLSPESSYRWMNWGMMSNGRFLTVGILEYRRTGNECSLSAILEKNVDSQYFLSKKAQEFLVRRMEENKKMDRGFAARLILDTEP